MTRRSPGQYLTRFIDRVARAARALWYRHFYLSWVHFGPGVVFDGPIRCPGVTGAISIGARTHLGPNISLAVAEGGSITLGADCSVNQGTILVARHSLTIGDSTRIGDHCSIRDSDHRLTPETPLIASGFVGAPVTIGRDVWIGRQVTIMPGVAIGDNAVIGAHSLVNTDVPEGALAVGTPARVRRAAR